MDQHRLSLEDRRNLLLGVAAIAILIVLIGLVKLQVFQHATLKVQSENNQLRVEPIVPRRGVVYDRESRVVVDNRPSYTLSVVPAEERKFITIPNLAELLRLDSVEVRNRIKRNMTSAHQPATIVRDVALNHLAVLEEQSIRFPGVTYQMEKVRRYTDGLGSEAFTGYVGEVSEDEIRRASGRVDYRLGSMIGKKGLEKFYDSLLRGQEGTQYIEVTATGQAIGPYSARPPLQPVQGTDLITSIDVDLQRACVAILDSFCCGAIVAIDPRNGEILAFTSYPSWDANMFSSVVPESSWNRIIADSSHPLLNRPLNGLYPPGSTVKFVAVGAALDQGLVTENTLLKPCGGGYQFGNRFFGCWEEMGHGALTAVHSLERSCDTYLYQAGIKLGVDELGRYYRACGFGAMTNIDLPNESQGLIPSTDYYDNRYGKNKWTKALVLNLAIGQGEILVTPMQLAQFFCGLGNNGVVYRPHMVKAMIGPDGTRVNVAPTVAFTLPFKPRTLELLKEGVRLVVEGDGGTARRLRNKYYSVGGKTGTAQNPHGDNHSWFVGMAPLEAPEIVVCAIVENAGHGSDVAAPVVGEVIKAYMFKKLGIKEGQLTVAGEEGTP
jgi:penicillin-binding protein 2